MFDGVDQRTDPLHRNINSISMPHEELRVAFESDTSGGACRDDISGREPGESAEIGDDSRDGEDHVAKLRRLHGYTVQTSFDPFIGKWTSVVRSDLSGTKGASFGKVLAWCELVCMALPIAQGRIVEDRIAGN